jgi:hypothetical protein
MAHFRFDAHAALWFVFHFDFLFLVDLASEKAIAIAWLRGLPALTSVAMFSPNFLLPGLAPLFSGIVHPLSLGFESR